MDDNSRFAEKVYKFALYLLLILLPVSIAYLWSNTYTINGPIDDSKFGTFGDFIGGVLGSIWSLCGVLLFYTALNEQRKDFKTNKDALSKQIEALNIQIQEFRLQREELKQSRQVYVEQAKTLRQQRLESTYFSLLGLYNKIVANLNTQAANDSYFKNLKSELFEHPIKGETSIQKHNLAKDIYLEIFYKNKEELSHYFKLIYRILKIIDDSDIEDNEKFRYIKILRSQLSENEMLALYYNSHSNYGGELYKLILKYNLLKHLPCISKIEFCEYLSEPSANDFKDSIMELNKRSSFLLRFNNELLRILNLFTEALSENIINEDFEFLKVSYPLPLCNNLIISLNSMELNELTIEIFSEDKSNIDVIANLKRDLFLKYFVDLIYDSFIYSRYIDLSLTEFDIFTSQSNERIKFSIESSKKISTNTDME